MLNTLYLLCSFLNSMCLRVSKTHIRSGFCVFTGPSEWCSIPAHAPCSGDQNPEAPLSLFSLPLLSSVTSSSDPHPAWRALCFIWPAGLLHSHRPPPHHHSSETHTLTTQNHIISMCSRRQLNQIENVSSAGSGECFPTIDAARPASSKTQCYSLCFHHPTRNRSPLIDSVAWFLESKLTVHNTHYMLWKSYTGPIWHFPVLLLAAIIIAFCSIQRFWLSFI